MLLLYGVLAVMSDRFAEVLSDARSESGRYFTSSCTTGKTKGGALPWPPVHPRRALCIAKKYMK